MALEPAAFEAELAVAAGTEVGTLRLGSERAAWPLVVGGAATWCGPGWVLVGDAAHVVHPLAGQGLNLGLADVAALSAVVAEREPWRGVGDERLLRRYVRQRAAPTWAMTRITDGLLRLFAEPSAPIRELRNNGMSIVNRVAPLKRWLTARALDS
jgi:2-polyprenyl-6-methoxyphenol hydroxylase-like FAD-dependent oxidoreductase